MKMEVSPPSTPSVMVEAKPELLTPYRPDIDGLRGVSIILVAVYHAFPNFLPSGFIGVDIFFTISGFLISGIILRQLAAGRFRFWDFYAKRIKRIFPALFLMLSGCLLAGWLLLFPNEWEQLGKHLFGGSFFVSNLFLMKEGGYFDAGIKKPLLHLWSLGIEEQFYIVWPVLLAASWKFRRSTLLVVFTMFCLSLIASIGGTKLQPRYAFFFPATRFWELALGAILAYVQLSPSARKGGSNQPPGWTVWMADCIRSTSHQRYLSWTGGALLVASVFLIADDSAFPGAWPLLPTLAAALLIAAGPGAWLNRSVLSANPMVAIGLISYPLYLWHWPVLVFTGLVDEAGFHWGKRMAALVVSCVLAWTSYQFVEGRLRHHPSKNVVPVLLIAAVFLLGGVGLLARFGTFTSRLNTPVGREVAQALRDGEGPVTGVNYKKRSGFSGLTFKGRGPVSTLFIGDSHMGHYYGRLAALEARGSVNFGTTEMIVHGIVSSGAPYEPRRGWIPLRQLPRLRSQARPPTWHRSYRVCR